MSRFFLFAVFTVVSAATVHRMEAVFKELTMKPDGSGVDHIKLEYSEETKKNLQQILETRASQLTGVYCKGMTELMVVYARDHASQFNATDIYDVSTKILESLKGRDVFTPVIEACQKDNTTASVGSAEKRQALLTLLCVTSSIERERDALNAIEMVWRWSVNSKTDAALADLSTMFSCPQAMMKLALYQLDVEYKRDGVAKAHEAGKLSKESMDNILATNPVPTRGDHLRYMAKVKIDAAREKAAAASKITEKEL